MRFNLAEKKTFYEATRRISAKDIGIYGKEGKRLGETMSSELSKAFKKGLANVPKDLQSTMGSLLSPLMGKLKEDLKAGILNQNAWRDVAKAAKDLESLGVGFDAAEMTRSLHTIQQQYHTMKQMQQNVEKITENFEKWKKMFKKEYKDAFADIRETFGNDFKKNLSDGRSSFNSIGLSLKSIVTSSDTWLKLTSAIVAEGYKLTNEIYRQQEKFVKETGMTFSKTNKEILTFYDSLGVTAARLGYSMDEMGNVAPSLVKEFGTMDVLTKDMAKNMLEMSRSLGLDTNEAAGLFNTIMNKIGVGSEQMTKNFIVGTYELAKQSKVAPKAVMKQIESSAKTIAMWYKAGSKSMAETAIYATRLGTTMDNLSSTAEGLVNFETSIEREMEAGVLLGRRFNLERARSLAFQGKLKDMNEEILRQVGGIHKWDKMDWYQKKAIAESVNMTVDGMTEQLNKAKQTKEIQDKLKYGQTDPFQEAMKGTLSWGDALEAMDKQGYITQISNSIKALGQALASTLYPALQTILPVISYVFNGLGKLAKWISELPAGVRGVLGMVIAITALYLGIKKLIALKSGMTMVGTAIKNIAGGSIGGPGGLGGAVGQKLGGGFKSFMQSIADGFKVFSRIKPVTILKTALALGVLVAALAGLAGAAVLFGQAGWEGFGMMIGSLIALSVAVSSFGGLSASGIGWLGVALILALGAAMVGIGYAAVLFSQAMDTVYTAIGKLVLILTDALSKMMDAFVGSILKLSDNVSKIWSLTPALLALAGAFVVLSGAMVGGSLAGGISNKLLGNSLVDSINAIADKKDDINGVANAMNSIVKSVESLNNNPLNVDFGKIKDLSANINAKTDEAIAANRAILEKLDDIRVAVEKNRDLYVDGIKLTYELSRISSRGGGDRTLANGII